jgi:ribosomal protein S18 acetylase RimI-like enzyme
LTRFLMLRIPHPPAMEDHLLDMPFNAERDLDILPETAREEFNEALLDNPIWNALETRQAEFAERDGSARRYQAAIGPLGGIPNQSLQHYDELNRLVGPGGLVVLFLVDPPARPSGWSLVRGGELTQMVCSTARNTERDKLGSGAILRTLGVADVSAMLELTTLTEPGPFRERTIELGNFYGIFEGDRLLAMAGQRMRVPGFVEVSAVCTHPDARGRGYAGILMREVMRDIFAEGATPFLHAFADNPAVQLYEKLGFTHRRSFHLAVIKREQ